MIIRLSQKNDPAAIDDVITGCVTRAGDQAIQFAAQAIMSGTQDIVIAAGIQSMTRAPM